MTLSVGRLDRTIQLQTASVSTDSETGQEMQAWSGNTIKAEWLPQTARETWHARQIDATIEAMVRTHYRADVFPDRSRIIDESGRVFDVKGVTEEGRRRSLLIAVASRAESL